MIVFIADIGWDLCVPVLCVSFVCSFAHDPPNIRSSSENLEAVSEAIVAAGTKFDAVVSAAGGWRGGTPLVVLLCFLISSPHLAGG